MDDQNPQVIVAAILESLFAKSAQEFLGAFKPLHHALAVRTDMRGKIRKHGFDKGKQLEAGRAGGR
eukprot:630203-Alexandrium_andersonii.AAC.1